MLLSVDSRRPQRRRVYLDKIAWSLLWRCKTIPERDLRRLRSRLCSPLFADRPVIMLSQWVFTEMSSRLKSPAIERQVAAELDLVELLPDRLILRAPIDVMLTEIALALGRDAPDMFFPRDARLPINDRKVWQAELRDRGRARALFFQHYATRKAEVESQWPDRSDCTREMCEWFSQDRREEIVLDWARTDMRRDRDVLGLPWDEALWPHPKTIRSIWGRTAFKAAHVFVINRDRRAIDGNDFFDWCHFTAAAQADVLVTRDRMLVTVANECPGPKPKVVWFEDWAEEILGGSARRSAEPAQAAVSLYGT